MTHPLLPAVSCAFLPALLLAACAAAAAQTGEPAAPQVARIVRVTLHPGAAVVERVARVSAGAREVVLSCLPEGFDPASLRIDADAPLTLGPVTLSTLPRASAPECQRGELDGRIRALEDKLAAVQAESLGHELVLGHLRAGGGKADDAGGSALKVPAAQLAATLGAVQRLGQDAAVQQHRLARERERLERELAPLRSERDRLRETAGNVRRVSVQIQPQALRDGELRLRYLQVGPTWGPAYRAELDTDASRVRVDRLAQVTQASGEDWRGIALRLSTGSPQAAVAGPAPRPWQWVVQPPMVAQAMEMRVKSLAAPAPAMRADVAEGADGAAPEPFQVATVESEFSTEFVVPGTVDVASSGQLVSLTLETLQLPARWLVETVPSTQPTAWLRAEVQRPAGVWPEGPLQLLRERKVVGTARWPGHAGAPGATPDTLTLPFGRDELLRVQLLPTERRDGSAGIVGQRAERRIARAYAVENAHRQPVLLRVLEPVPTAVDERITIERRLTPAPTHTRWQDQSGVSAWELTLAPGQRQRLAADYGISYPKDLPVRER
jgi:uncharacterized protein (TIGR02231 family)